MERPFSERIRQRLEATGKSVRRASLDAGLSETALKDILANEKQSPKIDTLTRLAAALDTTPAWLAFGIGEEIVAQPQPELGAQVRGASRRFGMARVDGKVQAGAWLQSEIFDDDEGAMISAPRDPEFPFARQLAYEVQGDSMNAADRSLQEGDFVICAAFEDLGIDPEDGMIVVVQQTINDGQLREKSVKEVRLYPDRTEFVPRSTNPAHKPIVVPKNRDPNDGREVKILGLVRFVFNNTPVPVSRKVAR